VRALSDNAQKIDHFSRLVTTLKPGSSPGSAKGTSQSVNKPVLKRDEDNSSKQRVLKMNQQDVSEPDLRQPNAPRDLLAKLYREIGISAVVAALESSKREKAQPIEPSQNPAVLREEKAA
jgi:hypothetical protein